MTPEIARIMRDGPQNDYDRCLWARWSWGWEA